MRVACVLALLLFPWSVRAQSASDERQSIRAALEAGRYDNAQSMADALLDKEVSSRQSTSRDHLLMIGLAVQARVANGRGAESRTRTLAEEAVRGWADQGGGQAAALCDSHRDLGDVLVAFGQYQAAREQFEIGLRAREGARVDARDIDLADDLDRLGAVLTLLEQYDQALVVLNRAFDIKTSRLDRRDVRLARTLEARGLLYQRRGDYSNSRVDIDRALEIREAANPAHPATAGALSLKGVQSRLEGDPVGARVYSAHAVEVAESSLRPDHPELATYLRLLAIPVEVLGELSRARELRQRALDIAQAALGPDHLAVAVFLNDLASGLFGEGQYALARPLFERALAIYERRLGPDHSGATTAVYNLAVVSDWLGDYQAARRQYRRAISTWQRVVGADHPFVALAMSQLAELLSRHGSTREARTLFERALMIRERTLGPNHTDVAKVLTSLATAQAGLGDARLARETSSRALSIWEQSSARDTAGAADALLAHGKLLASVGDSLGAEASYERALAMLKSTLGAAHPDVGEVEVPLGDLLAKTGRSEEALLRALDAERVGREHLRLMLRNLPERQGMEYAAKRPRGLDLAFSIAAEAPVISDTATVFDGLIRSRGLVLDEMARRRHASLDSTRSDLAPLWEQLVSARQRYANTVIRGVDDRNPAQYRSMLDDALQRKETAEREFADRSAAFEHELRRPDVGLDEVRTSIPRGAALVSYARYARTRVVADTQQGALRRLRPRIDETMPSYVAFVLGPGATGPRAVPLGSAARIDAIVADWRREVVASALRSPRATATGPSLRSLGVALRRMVWDPVAANVGSATRVFLVPDGTINLIAFSALPSGSTRYLVEDGPVIHYLSAERDLVGDGTGDRVGGGLLAVGGPAFADGSSFAALRKRTMIRAETARRGRQDAAPRRSPQIAVPDAPTGVDRAASVNCVDVRTMTFPALPGSRMEAQTVAGLWQRLEVDSSESTKSEALLGAEATEGAFKARGPGHRVLHVATHGFFLGDGCQPASPGVRGVGGLVATGNVIDNPLLLSGLALAGANRRAVAGSDEDDGILTAEEVASLNFEGVQWAVLSACDTGLGTVTAGEGVFGLRRAFQIAGVRTVIMSLWSVEDSATKQWMEALYQGRLNRHLDTADSVHEASLSLLEDRRSKGRSTNPFYWAGFVAAGDWR